MAEFAGNAPEAPEAAGDARPGAPAPLIEGAAYELLRARLAAAAGDLRTRIDDLDRLRRETFGGVNLELLATERVATDNNCVPRDLAPVGDRFLFGFNVQLHLRSQTRPADVFAVFRVDPDAGELQAAPLADLLDSCDFERDFADLYKYYKAAAFVKFSFRGPYLYALFRIGAAQADVKAFKWLMRDSGALEYLDNRSAHEVTLPPQHEFEWVRATRDMHRQGRHPHISIADRVFVETVGGDLTVKIEDNTATGEGIYSEPVAHADQTLDDAEIHYALAGNLILLRVKPYQEMPRYIVYAEKVKAARRVDAVAACCVQLPEDHGLVFPNGYFLQTGEVKEFDFPFEGFEFRRRIASPNGEDTLFVFHNASDGRYVLLFYNLIERQCPPPIVCHGFSLFADGALLCLRA